MASHTVTLDRFRGTLTFDPLRGRGMMTNEESQLLETEGGGEVLYT